GTRAGQSAAGNAILGRQAFLTQTASEPAVSVVVAQDWLCSERPPEEVRHHVSSCVALSAPGPHAFLLCVPVDRPADMELRALEALEKVFGPTAVSGHTLVLFTHTDQMVLGQQLDEYITTRRKDLLELVVMCGDRYHSLERRSRGEKDERKSVEELLEKVEQTVKESGVEFYSCPLYQEAEARVREKQAEIVWQRRGGEELDEEVPSSASPPEEELDDEEMAKVREEAERSVHNLNIDTDGITSLSPASSSPTFLSSLWQGLTGWLRRLPKMLRMESLLGAFVGLFVGGPVGRMLGATVGSVATEVGRRKTPKTEKNK
uniref:Si:dkeyp-69e1.8 n=1 Tax=Oncorhynchus kisutch TaxID=8019 RepID=A0A8C7FVT8_ONCKI